MNNKARYFKFLKEDTAPQFILNRIEKFYDSLIKEEYGNCHLVEGKTPKIDDIVLQSNDYLSLANNPEIKKCIVDSVLQDNNTQVMSGVYLKDNGSQAIFEKNMANFLKAEDVVVCQSGYDANVGLIAAIANKETPVYIDKFAHMSLWQGANTANAPTIKFKHNSPEHLEQQIKLYGAGIIAVDSIYSTTGAICPLEAITRLATKYNCVLVVDESHSLGTYGKQGAGLVVDLKLTNHVMFRTASLAKSFAARSGIIACSKPFGHYLKFASLPAMFSSILLPYEIAGLQKTLEIIQEADSRRISVQKNASYLRIGLLELGYCVGDSKSQIVSIYPGDEVVTYQTRVALENRNVYGAVFCPPATPKGLCLIRFTLNSDISREELDKVLEVCKEIREEVGLSDWSSSQHLVTKKKLLKGETSRVKEIIVINNRNALLHR